MKNFHLADGFPGDLKRLIVTRMLIQASSGGGKSWALRRLLEQTHGALQQLIIDPEGEFFTLREKFDYVLVAKQGGDAAAEPRIAGLLVERLLELNVSAILDLYELKADQRVLFVKNFLEALMDAPRTLWHPALVVVDEAHVFCPEKEKAESAGAVKDLCTRGRKRGFCGVLATQRLAKLAKDAAAECTNKLLGRTNLDVDLKRASDELGFKEKTGWPELRNLGDGDFFAYGPALTPEVRRIHVGAVLTTHPKVGVQLAGDAPPPTEKIKALLPKLSDLPAEQERKARTEAELRGEIRSLKAQLAARPTPAPAPAPKPIEVQVLDKALVARLEKAVLEHAKLQLRSLDASEPVQSAIKDLQRTIAAAMKLPATPARTNLVPFESGGRGFESPLRTRRPARLAPAPGRQLGENGQAMGKGELVILRAVAQMGVHGATREQLTVLTGYKRSTRDTYLQRLSLAGRVIQESDRLVATLDGINSLGPDFEPLPTGDALREHWMERLPEGERKILELLVGRYPAAVERQEVSDQTGYARSSRDTYIQRLKSRRLVEVYRDGVLASEILFS